MCFLRYFISICFFISCPLLNAQVKDSVFANVKSDSTQISIGNSNIKNQENKKDQYFYDADIERALKSKLPKEYVIGGVEIIGTQFYDKKMLLTLAHLQVGEKITIPGGDQLSKAIQHLWNQNLFEHIQVYIQKIEDRTVFLELEFVEKPRLKKILYSGIKKTEIDEIETKIGVIKNRIITNQMKRNITETIKKYFLEKGYLDISVILKEADTKQEISYKFIYAYISKGSKNKISDIAFFNNQVFSSFKLRSKLSETKILPRLTLYPQQDNFYLGTLKKYSFKEFITSGDFLTPTKVLEFLDPYFRWNIFNAAKFDKQKYLEDQDKLLDFYKNKGYRDISIEKDTVYIDDFSKRLKIEIRLLEGRKYYFGNMEFIGNTKFSDSLLRYIMGIQKGDVYDIEVLNSKLGKKLSPDGMGNDISSLYMDDGYLFFNVEPIETKIYNDTIDYLISIREGPQATIKRININGNEKTRDYVVRRELRTYPGEKFSRSDLIRSQRELSNLSFFNPEKIGINPVPNMEEGTVDINYTVEEKSSDQIELSAGYSGYIGITGTLGLSFNNFSTKHFFEKEAWKPLPSGDGQKLSFRIQSSGASFYTSSISFTEPWLSKKNRTSLSLSTSYTFYGNTRYTNTAYRMIDFSFIDSSNLRTFSSFASIGKQLKWPDDYFTLSAGINYTLYKIKNYYISGLNFTDGSAHNLSLKLNLSRSSIDQPLFTRSGSIVSLTGQLTLPYSLINPAVNPNLFAEYHKWKFNAEWYVPLTKGFGVDKNRQLVLKLSTKFGILGRYNSDLPYSAFERFQVGSSGLMNSFSFLGFDIISQRGYYVYNNSNPKVNPQQEQTAQKFTMFQKHLAELRYPISTSQSATIFVTTYFEAVNGWYGFETYNPLQLRRSVGVGARFFLPMFGLLGFDYAVGIDRMNDTNGIGPSAKFSFILGVEPE